MWDDIKTLWDELDGANCLKRCRECTYCKAMGTKVDHDKIICFLAELNDSYIVI